MAVMALAVILLTGACTSSGDDEIVEPTTTGLSTAPGSTPADTTSTSSSPTSSNGDDLDPSAEAVDGYLNFWAARFEANTGTPNPDDPSLTKYATGPQLENVVAETQGRLEAGHALREADPSQTRHDVTVASIDGDRAELQDCFVNDGVVYEVDGGGVVDDSVVTRSVSAEMVFVAGEWKLERATVVQEWEGIAGCALAS